MILCSPARSVGSGPDPSDEENPGSPLVEVNPADVYSDRMRDDLISPRGDRRPDVYRLTVGGEES